MASCEALATKAELQALKSELISALGNKLDRSEKQQVIQESSAFALGAIRPEIVAVQAIASAAAQVAADALGIGKAAQGVANSALGQAGRALGAAQVAGSQAASALGQAGAAAGSAAQALAKFAAIASAIAAIGASIATLAVLGARIDAVERYVDSIGNTASQALSSALSALGIGGRADRTANRAVDIGSNAQSTASSALSSASTAGTIASLALQAGTHAQATASNALSIGGNARTIANRAVEIGSNALATASNALGIGGAARTIANAAVEIGTQAQATASAASNAITSVRNTAQQALNTAIQALQRAGVPGQRGERGLQGVQGVQGIQGVQGVPGQTIVVAGAASSNIVSSLQSRVGQIEREAQKQESMNNEALALLRAMPITLANNSTFRAAATSAAAAGTCQTTRPGGCLNNAFNGVNQHTSNVGANLANGASQVLHGAALQSILQTVGTINTKMGAAMTGGLSGGLSRMSSFLGIERIMNLLTTLAVLHNAAMLSSALKDSLLSMVSSIGQATGLLKDSEGNALDTNALFNEGVEAFLKTLMGAEIYENTKSAFIRANRFYQASANIVNSFQNIANGIQAITERTGEYTGKIGNALKRFGLVGESAYAWMSENMNTRTAWLDRLESRISQTQEVISGIDDIAQNVVSIKDSVTQLKTEKENFDKALKDLTPNKPADNSVVATKVKTDKEASQPPATTFADLPK